MDADPLVTIYALVDETGAVRYIGQTRNVARRCKQHGQVRPGWTMTVLATVAGDEADEMERRLIVEHEARGCALTNWTHTQRARREMRAIARAQVRPEKTERLCLVQVRLPESLKARLDAKRAQEHRSLHAEILKAIDNHLACGERNGR